MNTRRRKCIQTIWMAAICTTLTVMPVIDCKVVYAKYSSQKELHCGCTGHEKIQTRLWYKEGALLGVNEDPENEWAPQLLYQNETLRLQIYGGIYYTGNVTYKCFAILENGSKDLCGDYTVKAFYCREHSDMIKPQNVTNLKVGQLAVFTCKQSFSCDKVNEPNKSVSIISMARKTTNRNNSNCTISEYGLKHECQLKIPNIRDEDFEKPVQCVVNDGGIVSVYEAFLFKKEVNTICKEARSINILFSVTVAFIVVIMIIVYKCCIEKCKSKYKCLSFLDSCRKVYRNNHRVLVYSVDEEEEFPLHLYLNKNDYELKTYNGDVNPGENKTEAFSELASQCIALIILVHAGKLEKDEIYKNRFHNILKSQVAKGQCCVRLYYTTILYVHPESNGRSSCIEKTTEKNFVSFDICDNQHDVEKIKEKLRKRLPSPKPDADSNSHSLEESFGSNDTVCSWSSNNNNVKVPHYSRMESNMSCLSTTPLFGTVV